MPYLQKTCPAYLEEIQGLADGAQVEFETILALNVRTEIGFGLLNDGCTAFAIKTKTDSFIGQNWDWDEIQAANIIRLKIAQNGKPTIDMMTEAGIIGKIGLNNAGVGVTLNAIYATGVAFDRLPCHLALKSALESWSLQEAKSKLTRDGVASACHIIVADIQDGSIGFENTAFDQIELEMVHGINVHTNHMVQTHSVIDRRELADSCFRLDRIRQLLTESGSVEPSISKLRNMLRDEENSPCAINRSATEKSRLRTIFSIVMDLGNKYAIVKMGRPTEDGEEVELRP